MSKIRLPKKLLALALAGALTTAQAAAAFSDTSGHWAEEAVSKWSETYQLINGYDDGTFRPDANITRGAFAGILDRFMKFQNISPAETFSDTAGSYWESQILKLHASGVYLGNEGRALADHTITRQQAVTMIARAFDLQVENTDLPYQDADRVAEYARGYLAEMTARGYITDSADGLFRPETAITRAEIVNLLNNMVDVLLQTPVTYTEDVAGSLMINAEEGAALRNLHVGGDLILAPGVQGAVFLENVSVGGSVRNFSNVEIVVPETPTDPETPENPEVTDAIQPSDVYTPSATTGETISYGGQSIPVYADKEKSRLQEGDFVWEEDRLVYVGGEFDTRFGIDVSAYQNRASDNTTIDWEAVANDGVDFAMVRVGGRGTSSGQVYADAFYGQNIDGAMDAGIETGVYFFAQAITVEEALEEADFVLGLLENHEISGPVAYDWEMHDASYRVYGTTPEMATACAIAFCQRIEEAGYEAMVYGGQYVSYVKYDQGALASYLYWYPEYKSDTSETLTPGFYYQMDYWQFSSACSIDGIGGRVDVNIQFLR